MSLPLITAVAPRWESGLAGSLSTSGRVHVARRCADVAELLGVAAAGLGRVAVVSADLRGLDRSVVDSLHQHGLLVLGVHPPDDEAAERTLRRWGLSVVVPADTGADALEDAVSRLLDEGEEAAHASGARSASDRRDERTASDRATDKTAGLDGGAGESGPGESRPAGTRPADSRRGETAATGSRGRAVVGPATDPLGHGAGEPARADALRSGAMPEGEAPYLDQADPGRTGGATADGEGQDQDQDAAPGTVVVVWGPTGSPGRTTVAVNLAAELADPLTPVVLVDADTYGASAAQVLAVLDEVPGVAAAARAADQGTLDRATLARLAPEVRPGMRILTGLPRADRWPEIRDVALADVLEQCRQLARFTVVDVAAPLEQDEELSFDTLAPRRNGAALTALDAADRVVVVGTGDPVGLQRLVRGLDLLSACTHAERTVVVTRVRPGPVGPDPGRRIQEALDRFASAGRVHLIPEDQDALDLALLHGRALLEVRPRSPARLALAGLADIVADRVPATRREHARSRRWAFGRRVAPA